ncbi:MAG TPA: hypothetical protein PKM41_02500 [Deltaproteobacteria bacterium]|nr:hypothetical protein [Deltaproteobacteria bacterium]
MDLPVSHSIKSPVSIDLATTEVIDPTGAIWLARSLRKGVLDPIPGGPTPTVRTFFHARRIVIINCLDLLYGHSLLKLLNVQRHLEKSPEIGCCVLTTPQLSHLVPEGVAEIWEIPVAQKDGGSWHTGLQEWMDARIRSREEVFLSRAYSHPSSSRYDLNLFVRDLPDVSGDLSSKKPVILFSYREDRTWGPTLAHQRNNLQKLHDRLLPFFPNMAFVLVGFGKEPCIRDSGSLIDLRGSGYNRDLDRKWLAYMKASDCAIGVHGSNMLLPSGLARATVELMPATRLGNMFQDILLPPGPVDPRDIFLRYRFLYGNDTLSDVTSREVALLVASILANNSAAAAWFGTDERSPLLFTHEKDPVMLQAAEYLMTVGQPPSTPQEQSREKIERFLLESLHRLDINPGEKDKL